MLTPGHHVIVEHKTTSLDIGPASTYWRRLTLDSQISNYMEGARALGVEPAGVLYDVIRKVQLRRLEATPVESRKFTAKGFLYANQREQDETLEEYRARVRADIGENPDKYFQRGIITRHAEEERDAAHDAWGVGREIREAQLASRWPRNPDACDSFGSLCTYFDVCTGVASIDDPTQFRTADTAHEELADGPVVSTVDEDKRHLPVLSTSAARCYRSCPRKYLYSYEQRRRRISDAQALRFGTLIHRGLEQWWMTGDLASALAAMTAGYGELDIDPVDQVRAEELLLGYHVRWHAEPLEVIAVEAQFRSPLVNPATGAASKTWVRGGKLDALARVLDPAAHADTVPPAPESGVHAAE